MDFHGSVYVLCCWVSGAAFFCPGCILYFGMKAQLVRVHEPMAQKGGLHRRSNQLDSHWRICITDIHGSHRTFPISSTQNTSSSYTFHQYSWVSDAMQKRWPVILFASLLPLIGNIILSVWPNDKAALFAGFYLNFTITGCGAITLVSRYTTASYLQSNSRGCIGLGKRTHILQRRASSNHYRILEYSLVCLQCMGTEPYIPCEPSTTL